MKNNQPVSQYHLRVKKSLSGQLRSSGLNVLVVGWLFGLLGAVTAMGSAGSFITASTGGSDTNTTAVNLITSGVAFVDTLGGNVINDFDNDGADAGASEVGQESVLVEVYDCGGMLVCSVFTNADGDWACDGLNDMEEYRVEFSTPLQPYLQPSFGGADNGTNTQFVTVPYCDVDYGVLDPSQFCGDVSMLILALSCYESGTGDGANSTKPAFISFAYNATGNTMEPNKDITIGQIGSTWGRTYVEETAQVFAGTVLKRHIGLADRLGTLYRLDYSNPNSPSFGEAIELEGVVAANTGQAISFGTVSRLCPDGIGSYTKEGDASCQPAAFNTDDFFDLQVGDANQDGSIGSALIVPGTGELVKTVFDPMPPGFIPTGGDVELLNTQVIHWNSLTDGVRTDWYRLVDGSTSPQTFAKRVGLGDLTALCPPTPIQIVNFAWTDADEDGVQDACEEPVENLPVSLFTKDDNGDLTLVASTTTNSDGEYYFTGDGPTTEVCSPIITLSAGDEPEDGTDPDEGMGSGATQDNASPLRDANGDMTIDMGFFAPVSLGETAFIDIDGDGIRSIGDEPLPGVVVTLYDGETMIPFTGMGVNGNTVVPLTTDMDGAYMFRDLPPGDYYVIFDTSTIANADLYEFTTPNQGDDIDDSDAIPDGPGEDMARSEPTGNLDSCEEFRNLDVGVACAIGVEVAQPFTICNTQPVNLLEGASISPERLGGSWSISDGTGSFVDANGNTMAAPFELGVAAEYLPSEEYGLRGFVALVLTSGNLGELSPPSNCEAVSSAPLRMKFLTPTAGSSSGTVNDNPIDVFFFTFL